MTPTQRLIQRQYNYNRVPHPLMEGLVLFSFGTSSPEAELRLLESIEQMQNENELVKVSESN